MTIDPEWKGSFSLDMSGRQKPRQTMLMRDTSIILGLLLVLVLIVSMAVQAAFALSWNMPTLAVSMFFCIGVFLTNGLRNHPFERFGAANIVTGFRGALTVVIGAIVLTSEEFLRSPDHRLIWTVFGMALVALALDGIDGYLARKSESVSAFGARFDMEIDALLIFFLSLAAFAMSKAGVWVILSGAMRYGFVAAQTFFPRLRGELASSFRRKLVCVIQVTILCILLMPFIGGPAASLLALGGLIVLSWSFAVDVTDLYIRGGARK